MTRAMQSPGSLAAPRIGFMGWGPSSEIVLEQIRRRSPERIDGARVFGVEDTGATAPMDAIPSVEALFGQAELIFVDGDPAAMASHLPMMRLAISDRHMIALMGHGWTIAGMLHHLHERKVIRFLVRSFDGAQHPLMAFVASPYVSQGEIDGFCRLFAGEETALALATEQQFEVVSGLTEIAPAAFFTIMEAMADGALMMGLPRKQGLRLIAEILAGTAQTISSDARHPAQAREQALQSEVAAAGLLEMETSGIRGLMMRVVQEATRSLGAAQNSLQRITHTSDET